MDPNVPVGYALYPLPAPVPRSSSRLVPALHTPRTITPTQQLLPRFSPPSRIRLHDLPNEILLQVAAQLLQQDALRLAQVCTGLQPMAQARLYCHVVVDRHYSQFNREAWAAPDELAVVRTYIKSSFCLKSFLRSVAERPALGLLIRSFTIEHIPENAFDLVNTRRRSAGVAPQPFHRLLAALTRLRLLVWRNPDGGLNGNMALAALVSLPVPRLLVQVEVHLSENDVRRVYGEDEETHAAVFPAAEVVGISPFCDSDTLGRLVRHLFGGWNHGLRELRLVRSARARDALVPTNQLVVVESPEINFLLSTWYSLGSSGLDTRCIASAFASTQRLAHLTTLALWRVVVTPEDADTLARLVDLGQLRHLELVGVSEVKTVAPFLGMRASDLDRQLDAGFLERLVRHLVQLRLLAIDYREGVVDTVPVFLERLVEMHAPLTRLEVLILWNLGKVLHHELWYTLCRRYFEQIGRCRQLELLLLETKEENPFAELNKLVPGTLLLSHCSALRQLTLLRLNGEKLVQSTLSQLLVQLPRLRFLEVMGQGSAGAPHMALEVLHPGVLDYWFKVQHVAMYLAEAARQPRTGSSALRYVRVNKYLFEVAPGTTPTAPSLVAPRDGLERWFARHVRVTRLT